MNKHNIRLIADWIKYTKNNTCVNFELSRNRIGRLDDPDNVIINRAENDDAFYVGYIVGIAQAYMDHAHDAVYLKLYDGSTGACLVLMLG